MDLPTYYELIFSLVQHHKWSGEYIDGIYPFERDIHVEMLHTFLAKSNSKTGLETDPSKL